MMASEPKRKASVQRRTLAKLSVGVIILLALIAGFIWWYSYSLPQPLFSKTHAQVLLDRQGRLLSAHIADDGQWRFPAIENVPNKFSTALIQFEDRRFREHSGVDLLALMRATYDNLRQQKIVSGASTLSMQVIRLARGNPPRTLSEKAIEILRAWRLESLYSKDEILQLYASHAPFGGNVVGLEAAAWRYFARDPEQLSWAEQAMLAVLPNNPALIHLNRNRTQLLQKRNRLLARLYEVNALSKLDYELAVAEPLPEAPHLLPRLAPHLLDTLAARYPEGERFRSTIDANLQQQLVILAQRTGDQLALEGIQNLAVVVIDNHTMDTLAYVGNRPDMNYQAQLGHAIDLVQRPRSSGSTLKPLLFADMLEQGLILPDSLVADVPVNYTGFTPQNFNRQYHGAVTAREALARSLNIPLVNMLSLRGVDPFLIYLRQMGFQHLQRSARDYGLSLILGGAETSLWDLTVAYANLSHLAQSTSTKQGYWQQGRRLQTEVAATNRVATLSTATAWLTLDSLLGVARPGDEGYWDKFSSSRKVAWKTGTSYGQRDAWAIGTTPDYTVGVWVGNANGEGRAGLTGTKSAAPILFNTFNFLPAAKTAWFQAPKTQLTEVNICRDDGYLSNGFCEIKSVQVPSSSHFARITPYHQRIYVDASQQWRVNSECESIATMQARDWLVLPPDQAYYYKQYHADYQPLPPWRSDCVAESGNQQDVLTVVYPQEATQIYLPREIDGKLGEVVFRAVPTHPEDLLYWHLDNQFLGTTQNFHQLAAQPVAGKHRLAVVDETGNRVERSFEVLIHEAKAE
jgi:penicillin-binding protein 1C